MCMYIHEYESGLKFLSRILEVHHSLVPPCNFAEQFSPKELEALCSAEIQNVLHTLQMLQKYPKPL